MTRYNKEFKEQALKLSDEIGLKKAAAQLGLCYNTLSDWRKQRKIKQSSEKSGDAETTRRIKELEKENAELRRANDILKDALGFFAEDRKR